MSKPHVIVIGAGSTGSATAHDLALRGLRVTVIERGEVASGTTGRNHCLLHSGGRYCMTDQESAIECIDENLILRKIMPDLLELNDGLFVAVTQEDLSYKERFLEACAACHISARDIPIQHAFDVEPFLNPGALATVQVPNGVFEPFRFCLAFLATARLHGAVVRRYHLVTEIICSGKCVTGVKVMDSRTQAAYLWGMKQGGEREHRRIPYDDRFLKATCPTTTKGTAIVQKGSGVKINHFYYWNNAFRNPEVIKTAVPVRYDPFDLSTTFALVQGQWVTCRAPYLSLEGRTEKELLIATTELRRQARRDGGRADLSAERLATHMSKAVSHEESLRQRLRDLDQKKVLAIIASQSGHVQTLGGVLPSPVGPPEAVRAAGKLAALSMPVDVSRLPRLGDYS